LFTFAETEGRKGGHFKRPATDSKRRPDLGAREGEKHIEKCEPFGQFLKKGGL